MNAANILHFLWLGLAVAIGGVWAFRFIAIGMARKRRAILGSQSHLTAESPTPKLSVLVAARDEEANIESCIRTLLDQDYPDFEVIAIDDRSTDRTPELLQTLESESNGRLRVVTVTQPLEGWAGKNNAMREGVAISKGEWLMFTDADCWQTSRRTLSVAMAEVADKELDFLSIIPLLDTPTAWERIIQPICSWILILWFLPDRVNNPANRTAYANGAFMLMSRKCYNAIGGHGRVRNELNEDIMMARWAKRGGFTTRVTQNEDLFRTRMYQTPRDAWRGWSRIFFGSLGTVRRIGISLAMVGCYTLIPWIALAVSMLAWMGVGDGAGESWRRAVLAWLVVIVLQQLAAWRYYGLVRIGRLWSLTHVVGSCVVFGMLCSAMLKVLGATGTTWRGSTYHRGADGRAVEQPTQGDRAGAEVAEARITSNPTASESNATVASR